MDVRKVGARNYSKHPSTRLSLFSGAFNEGLPFSVEEDAFLKNQRLIDCLSDPTWTKVAWNIGFDQQVIVNSLGIDSPAEQWLDAMALVLSLGLPASLDKCGEAMGLEEDERKYRDGRRLITLFSQPHRGERHDKHSHPDQWTKWVTYGLGDVMSMRLIINKLRPYLSETFTLEEHQLFQLDGKLNRVGVPIDLDHCKSVVELNQEFTAARLREGKEITGLENPKSPQQLKAWLAEQDVHVEDMRANTLTNLLKTGGLTAPVRDAVQIRLDLSRSSVAKFQQLLLKTDPMTSRLYDIVQYYGAHTGRWAGRGVQLHNLPRGNIPGDTPDEVLRQMQGLWVLISMGDWRTISALYGNVAKVLSSTIRPTICAEPGKTLVVSDFSSIETAVIAWLAGGGRLLDLFHAGLDPYKDFASELLRIPYDAVSKKDRAYAKPAVLGAVFGLGAKGYQGYAAQFGQAVEMGEAQRIIDTFRNTYPEIPQFWKDLKSAAHGVLRGHAGLRLPAGPHVTFYKEDERFLFAELPSGRSLAYPVPRLTEEETQWGMREQLSYMTEKEYQWVRTATHPGKLAENVTQAVARDLLANSLRVLDQHDYETVLHVHDEVVVHVDQDQAEDDMENIEFLMKQSPAWARDIPIGTDAFITERYIKL